MSGVINMHNAKPAATQVAAALKAEEKKRLQAIADGWLANLREKILPAHHRDAMEQVAEALPDLVERLAK